MALLISSWSLLVSLADLTAIKSDPQLLWYVAALLPEALFFAWNLFNIAMDS